MRTERCESGAHERPLLKLFRKIEKPREKRLTQKVESHHARIEEKRDGEETDCR
jgi:hypothetical protein